MSRWAPVLPQTGGGRVGRYRNATTKAWFEAYPQIFLSFPYVGMDFEGEPNMCLAGGYAWGSKGMFLCLLNLLEYLCFVCVL